MKMEYFGQPWNPNIKDFIHQMPTPVGQNCGCGCGQTIKSGDKGVVMDHLMDYSCDDGEVVPVQRRPWLLDHFLSNLGLSR